MTKIKITGILIFSISIILAVLSSYISNQNKIQNDLLNSINEKKAFTQEISKNIFYIYKNQNISTKQIDDLIEKFIITINKQNETLDEISGSALGEDGSEIINLWNRFYLSVQKFRDNSKITTTYSKIILEDVIKEIYNTNFMLIVEFNKLIQKKQIDFQDALENYKNLQYSLFFTLVLLLIYLFTQVKTVIAFIQKFLIISKNIITDSSIKKLKPIEITNTHSDILEAINNFNYLVNKLNQSIVHSSNSIEHSVKSLETIESDIEDLLELLNIMENNNVSNKELTKKEDVIIQSLEELSNCALNLHNLKADLKSLLSEYNENKS
ncbi:hypothetical protein KKG72_07880 [bacterium]|nr:hypothetical protein [bacterium]MBU1994553.1 hypothetical protein [bacterium]